MPAGGFHGLAVRLAGDVLDEAVGQACARAREQLAAALADEIVAEALAGDAPAPAAASALDGTGAAEPAAEQPASRPGLPVEPPTGPPRDASTGTGLYAYGITDAASSADDIVGLDDRTVEIVRVGSAALVASTIDLDLLAGLEEDVSEAGQIRESGRLAALAGRHDRVMRQLLDRGPVLPLRFGTVLPDRPRAQRLLRASADPLAAELDRVRDHREWGLRVVPGDEVDERLPSDDTRAESGRAAAGAGTTAGESGTAYLSARREELRRAALREERLTGLTRQAHEQLAALASEVAMRSGRPGPGRLNAAYLVAGAKENDFLDEAAAATKKLMDAGCEASLTGPWPPYSFVRLTLGEASDD
jgi:hypothetical protein